MSCILYKVSKQTIAHCTNTIGGGGTQSYRIRRWSGTGWGRAIRWGSCIEDEAYEWGIGGAEMRQRNEVWG